MSRRLIEPMRRHDVVVVGARCAGAGTAMLLAAAGHDVLLLDRDAFPSEYPSPDGFMELLTQLELAVDAQAAVLAAHPVPQFAAA